MSRILFTTLALSIAISSGCSAVRGKYTACLSTPVFAQPHQNSRSYHNDYSPTPHFNNDINDPLPVLDLDEEIPPAPPAKLDTSWFNAKPLRKPVYPPMKAVSASWSKSVVEKFKF